MEVFAAACRAASERLVPFVIECVPKALKLSMRHLLRGDISRAALAVAPMIAAPAARCEAAPPLADSSAAAGEAERHAEALIDTATRAASRPRHAGPGSSHDDARTHPPRPDRIQGQLQACSSPRHGSPSRKSKCHRYSS